eukprot:PITA_03438
MSLLDGYSGYNQILVHEDDRDNTTFTTPWGTFHYAKMPFGLKNAGATFQHAMDVAFANEKDVVLVVYLYDLTVFSNSDEEHLYHLKLVFQKCRKYGISLNPKKSIFVMDEGKLLGHIISKDDIRIDPARVEAIQQIEQPRNKKEIQSFNRKLNFLRRFIPNLAEHLREITSMLKKDSQVKWTEEAVKSFNLVKLSLSSTPILISPDYTQDFILFSFASEHSLAAVLMQKREGVEKAIAFFSRIIRDGALKYNITEKQALALVKALKDFRVYILHSHILAYVPNATVKDILVQADPEGQHRWILTATDYFTKWIEAIPTRQATDAVIISFLETNILSRFRCPSKLITDNAVAFKSKRMIEFCYKYNISLGHSTAYHPQGNGLAESSNKSLVNIIKKLLEISKKGWHKKLINALWDDRVSQKKSIGMSPFEFVYGTDTIFPTSLVVPVVKLLQEAGSEEDPMQRRINQMIHLQQIWEEVFQNTCKLQEHIKKIYDRKAKADTFQLDEFVLRWDARHGHKGKHGKFENLWKGPYKIAAYHGQNAFLLKEMNGDEYPGGPINGRLLKRYYF